MYIKKYRGSQPNRMPKHVDTKSVIGIVPKLAQDALNPMWATTESVTETARLINEIRPLQETKKKLVSIKDTFKVVEVDLSEE